MRIRLTPAQRRFITVWMDVWRNWEKSGFRMGSAPMDGREGITFRALKRKGVLDADGYITDLGRRLYGA